MSGKTKILKLRPNTKRTCVPQSLAEMERLASSLIAFEASIAHAPPAPEDARISSLAAMHGPAGPSGLSLRVAPAAPAPVQALTPGLPPGAKKPQ